AREAVEAERAPHENRVWWLLCLVGGSLLFLVCAWLAHRHTLTGPNLAIFRHINDLPNGLRTPAWIITVAPSSLLIGVVAVVVAFALKLYQLSWQLAATVFAAGGLAWLGKTVIAEPRPYSLVPDVHMRAHEADFGFPSAHVLMVTVVVLTLWPYLPRLWRLAILLWIPLMAMSRIFLGVHTALDVTGGFALGLALVSAMRVAPEPLRKLLRFD
ncbi:MAG TPA: phosphatase PAP2 family protein, partial [Candidatus Saccharimonadales bacterium]